MLILHTFWPDYCSTKNSYWFNLVYPFLSFPSVRSLQQWKSKAYKVIHETSPLSDAEVSLYALYVN